MPAFTPSARSPACPSQRAIDARLVGAGHQRAAARRPFASRTRVDVPDGVPCALSRALQDLSLSHLERRGHEPVRTGLRVARARRPCSNVAAMSAAAALLEGRHDFAAFQATGTATHGTERVVFSSRVSGAHDGPRAPHRNPDDDARQAGMAAGLGHRTRFAAAAFSGTWCAASSARSSKSDADAGRSRGSPRCFGRASAPAPARRRRPRVCSLMSVRIRVELTFAAKESACRLSSCWPGFRQDRPTRRWRVRSTSSSCPPTSPSSWTATAAGPRSVTCRASKGTAPASIRCATSSRRRRGSASTCSRSTRSRSRTGSVRAPRSTR